MPERTGLRSVLIIGSGSQACRALKAEGLRVILVSSDPAMITTDPEIADATYVEPITPEFIERIIAKERPDGLLPTPGGRAALNVAVSLQEQGVLDKYGVVVPGTNVQTINRCQDGALLKRVVEEAGLTFRPAAEVFMEESVLGWKVYELELMRDRNDNVAVVCSIENVAPTGVHTGDSITVAPAMTLTDREYQILRDVGIAIIREVGVDTGGCTIQFAVDPEDGRVIVTGMNPHVSRSSALAAKLAVGRTLDETAGGLTERTPSSFGHVIVTTGGGATAAGRTFAEALNKALRPRGGDGGPVGSTGAQDDHGLLEKVAAAPHLTPDLLTDAKRHGFSDAWIAALRSMREEAVREVRHALGIRPVYRALDGPPGTSPCLYSSYDGEPEVVQRAKPAVIVLGPGSRRGALGAELGHSCLHAAAALRGAGYEAVLVGCDPEDFATDGSACDRSYAEPLTLEDVLEVVHAEQRGGPVAGVVVQFGGAGALRLARGLAELGVAVPGNPLGAVRRAGVRGVDAGTGVEIDVDALFDGDELYVGAVMECVGAADSPSGGTTHVLPPVALGKHDLTRLRAACATVAGDLGARGPLSIRFALTGGSLSLLSAEPSASRTVPFSSCATAVALARAGARIVLGATVAELRAEGMLPAVGDGGTLPAGAPVCVQLDGAMGNGSAFGASFGTAFAKARLAADRPLPTKGRVAIVVADRDKRAVILPVRELAAMGFELLTTADTADVFRRNGIDATAIGANGAGRPDDRDMTVAELVREEQVDLVVATLDGQEARTAASARDVPCVTTVQALCATVQGIHALRGPAESAPPRSLQEWRTTAATPGER
ncbi:hypothetical protein AB0N81_21415 [Streptomyces sp. NPDC093510]|uniref:carbamoyl phosphate synthase preATP-grasp domain-containing protein n=1 Tax=Streptomyces sp. NPDC093510 TaxID=3155199 RepID=UPI00344923B9